MSKYATGKHSKAISDRSGMEFPYREMVKEWNGSFVHYTEYEPKQPQLEPKPIGGDGVALLNVRPDRTEFPTPDFLPNNPFSITNGTKIMTVSFPDYSTEAQGGELSYVRFQGVKSAVVIDPPHQHVGDHIQARHQIKLLENHRATGSPLTKGLTL